MMASPMNVNGTGPPLDPLVGLLGQLADIGGPDDTRPPEALVESLDRVLEQIEAMRGPVLRESARDLAFAEHWSHITRIRAGLSAEELAALGALRREVEGARKALGMPAEVRIPAPYELALMMSDAGPLEHVSTGIATLDRVTRGGLLAARLHVIGGEPDAGKTAFVVQLAMYWARAGFAVLMHCVDEPRESIMDRLGQAFGLSLEDLEARKPAALSYLSERLREMPNLHLIDQRLDGLAVEQSAERLSRLVGQMKDCRGGIFINDSLQTARARGVEEARTEKDRLDIVTEALLGIAQRGPLVLTTSELNRGAYRSRKVSDRNSAMASFKGSGAIEYAMTTGLMLTTIKGADYEVRVDVPKNKRGLGRGVAFKLQRDPDRCTYEDLGPIRTDPDDTEEKAPAAPTTDEAQAAFKRKVEAAARKLVPFVARELIDAAGDGLSIVQIRERTVGKNAAKDRAVALAVAERLAAVREIKGRARFYAPSSAPPEAPTTGQLTVVTP